MLTVQAALDLGLPLYVCCRGCDRSSQVIDLQSLLANGKGDLDLEAFASRGGFRCSGCGSRKCALMPTMDFLISHRRRWYERCLNCARDRHVTAAEAVARFGMAPPVEDVRRQLKTACGRERCAMNTGGETRWPPLSTPPV